MFHWMESMKSRGTAPAANHSKIGKCQPQWPHYLRPKWTSEGIWPLSMCGALSKESAAKFGQILLDGYSCTCFCWQKHIPKGVPYIASSVEIFHNSSIFMFFK